MADKNSAAFALGSLWSALVVALTLWALWSVTVEPIWVEAEADAIRERYDRLDAEQDRQVREILMSRPPAAPPPATR